MKAIVVKKNLLKYSSAKKAAILSSFFKTGKGEYGEGDKFIGVKMPEQRAVAKEAIDLKYSEISKLLSSKIHEHRMTGLLILVYKFEKAELKEKHKIFTFYKKHLSSVNNWDLVDVTCDKIIGGHLLDKDRKLLYRYAKSSHLWTRRIAIVSTFAFIKKNDFSDTFAIAEILLHDKHDLIHKATGWMLREIGKRESHLLEAFLGRHAAVMPRTMLRYSIERFSEKKRKYYMGLASLQKPLHC